MAANDNLLTVSDAIARLKMNGVDWTEVWLRRLISIKKVKSVKIFNSRLIPKEEVSRIIGEHQEERARKGH